MELFPVWTMISWLRSPYAPLNEGKLTLTWSLAMGKACWMSRHRLLFARRDVTQIE